MMHEDNYNKMKVKKKPKKVPNYMKANVAWYNKNGDKNEETA